MQLDPRRELVDKARQAWTRKLIDLSRRNNLLYYRALKTGTLDLSNADPEQIARLVAGDKVPVRRLLPENRSEQLATTTREIARKALENSEEKGLQTLFVAFGSANWPASDDGRPTDAPVLLLPVTMELKIDNAAACSLSRNGAIQINLVLLHVLSELGLNIAADELLSRVQEPEEEDGLFNLEPIYQELQKRASQIEGFTVKPTVTLGNFAFQKMAMVKDLQSFADQLTQHDVIAAIAGDNAARSSVSATQINIDPKSFDQAPPENEFVVLDADSSQHCAISGIAAGQNAVVHGPPGTGKSQTIANLLATLAASGKRVLFVAEKRAALEVVLHRLESVGLDHLAIDLHGADLSPRKVMQHVAKTLDIVRNSGAVECAAEHRRLVDRRDRLNRHVERIHSKRAPAQKSIYELQGLLLQLGRTVESKMRWRGAELARLTPDAAQRVRDRLTEAAGFASLFLRTDRSPWTGANLASGADVRTAIDLVHTLAEQSYPKLQACLHEICEKMGLHRPTSVDATRDAFILLDQIQKMLERYSPEIYAQDLSNLLSVLTPAARGRIKTVWTWLTSGDFRRARTLLLGLRTTGKASIQELLAEVRLGSEQLAKWRTLSEKPPCVIADWQVSAETGNSFFHDLAALQPFLGRPHVGQSSLDEFGDLIRALQLDQQTPHQLPKLGGIEKELESAGAGRLVLELRKRLLPTSQWLTSFDYAWFASTFDAACEADVEIRGFKGTTHSGCVDEFEELDRERIALAAERVKHAHAMSAIGSMNRNPGQEQLIRAEAAKSRRHLPLRKVFEQAGGVLTSVCPCWMASPLSVSQLLDGSRQYFDCVVFDEASQVLPEDAVPAILRAGKVVVAGDNQQLPPTTFFASGEQEEYAADEESSSSQGFESLLDMMIPFVRQFYLDWHYRSRDEALINFSNRHLYDGRLVTFPGAGGPPVVSHVLVQQELGTDGQEESANAEIRKVVALILEHARNTPRQTLGVITMGIKHMYRLQAALDRELPDKPELHDFFDSTRRERFFIKNLERVQGDERDAIIISVGYGKDRAGNLPLRFGPLLSAGGRRRLNVAITRARQKLTVVSSFAYTDIDLARVRSGSGVEMLRDYLLYAATNGKRLGEGELTEFPPNAFETDVMDALTVRGLRIIPQMGASAFRIDLVAEHPQKPGRFVLAIECDGASYHSSYTARDRDRLRQQQLENLGWRFHRIWSTDWFLNKEVEVERTMAAFTQAVEFADRVDVMPAGSNGASQNNSHLAASGNGKHDRQRTARPAVARKESINAYRPYELVQLVKWISSDGQLRTDDQILSEMIEDLGFSRRGVRIETAIRTAIRTWHTSQK